MNVWSVPGREAKSLMGYPFPSFWKASILTKQTNKHNKQNKSLSLDQVYPTLQVHLSSLQGYLRWHYFCTFAYDGQSFVIFFAVHFIHISAFKKNKSTTGYEKNKPSTLKIYHLLDHFQNILKKRQSLCTPTLQKTTHFWHVMRKVLKIDYEICL